MKRPLLEDFGLTEDLAVSLEKNKEDYASLRKRVERRVMLAIVAGIVPTIALYAGYRFGWLLSIPLLILGILFVGLPLAESVSSVIVSRLDPYSRIRKQSVDYWLACFLFHTNWSHAYWEAFWKTVGAEGHWKDAPPEYPHSRFQFEILGLDHGRTSLPDPRGDLFLVFMGVRCVLSVPRPSEPVNRGFVDRLLKTVDISCAKKGVICSDEDISQELRQLVTSQNVMILTSGQLQAIILRAYYIDFLGSSLRSIGTDRRESILPFPKSMIRRAIAGVLMEPQEEDIRNLIEKGYRWLEWFLPDEELGKREQLLEEMIELQKLGSSVAVLRTLLRDHEQEIRAICENNEKLNKHSEKCEEKLQLFREIAARNVNDE